MGLRAPLRREVADAVPYLDFRSHSAICQKINMLVGLYYFQAPGQSAEFFKTRR
jgi:hypothetical protein